MSISYFFRKKLLTLLELTAQRIQVPDKLYLRIKYFCRTGKLLHLKQPKTFNEKLNWLKLHHHNPLLTTLADKYAVKDYVAKLIGEEYVVPNYGVWNAFDDIDLAALPSQFVLKATHDSGGAIIIRDKNQANWGG